MFNNVEIRRFSGPRQNTDVICLKKLLCCSSGMAWSITCARIMFLLGMIWGTRTGRVMSSWCRLAVRPLMTRISGVFVCIETPTQTMIFQPPPNLSIFSIHTALWCSPHRRYTRLLSSWHYRFILVSSTKRTFAQSALVNLRCRCAHAKSVVWCLWFRNNHLCGRLARRFTSLRLLRTVCDGIGRQWISFVSLTVVTKFLYPILLFATFH